ncbi:hypothetical protein AAGS40_27275 (plasmid) [Paraburkholderia sp. PREW-6R]|uniref:hypothetical protein n=1 Tax=Paraburkholderia sp. PREW-6R TaxID=3141544 RepID=UPI0031F4DF82
MHATALATLNMREPDRLKVIQAVVDMGVKPGRAVERLGLTVRQVERLVIATSNPVQRDWPRADVAVPATGGWTEDWPSGTLRRGSSAGCACPMLPVTTHSQRAARDHYLRHAA